MESVTEQIGLAILSNWAAHNKDKTFGNTIARLIRNDRMSADLSKPRLTHFIAEHAHQSLQTACQDLEFSMNRVNTVIAAITMQQGRFGTAEYGNLETLAEVVSNNLVMVAIIARATRSYSIGLRNAEYEVDWANLICSRLSRKTLFALEFLQDYFNLVRQNPQLLNVGKSVLHANSYPIETPTQRNW